MLVMNQHRGLLTVLFILSCSSTQTEVHNSSLIGTENIVENGFDSNTFESFLRLENYLTTAQITTPEIQVIDSTCAILVNPTEAQFNEMEETFGEEELAILTDDNGYFQISARLILDSASIKMTEVENRFIRLVGENSKTLFRPPERRSSRVESDSF